MRNAPNPGAYAEVWLLSNDKRATILMTTDATNNGTDGICRAGLVSPGWDGQVVTLCAVFRDARGNKTDNCIYVYA